MSVFAPTGDSDVFNLATTSQRFTLSGTPLANKAIRIARLSTGTPIVYVKFGDGSVTASTSDSMVALLASQADPVVFGVPFGATHVAFVVQASSVDMNVTEGVLIDG